MLTALVAQAQHFNSFEAQNKCSFRQLYKA